MEYDRDPRRVFLYGLTVMFILIGIAAVLSVIFNPHNYPSAFSAWIGVAGSVVGVLIGLFFLFIFIWVIVWFARSIGWISRSSKYAGKSWRWWEYDEALEILRERYARGEITKEQYEQMMNDLEKAER
ncbi:MAG: SHOCT domain-containing protein [Thermoplasmata archaeon]